MVSRKALPSLLSLLAGNLSRPAAPRFALGRSGARRYGALAAEADLENPVDAPYPVRYTQLLIDGDLVDAASGKTFPSIDPRNEEVIAQVAEGDAEDVDRAVRAARRAFEHGPWPKMPAHERGRILHRFADLVAEHKDELGALDAMDSGKPYDQARFIEVPSVAKHFRYFAGWADKIHGRTIPTEGPYFAYTLHEPIGVCGQIIPWNFPMVMFALKVAPALAAGNTVVIKSAEQTPLSAILAGKLALEAGVPPGVLNVISGFGETAGAAISGHMDVDKVAFTGSTAVGKIMVAAALSNIKKLNLELGGKSPLIVCDDADVDHAVELAHFSLFFNQGQCCTAASRTFVQEKVYDEFVEKAKARALRRVVGDPFRSGVEQGPQVDETQFEKVLGYIDSGRDQGATLIAGGERLGSKGFYIKPTVFGDVGDDMRVFKEEIFGPVQCVTKFRTAEEAVQRANRSIYGLAAGVVTKSIDNVNTISRGLKAGSVWVNTYHKYDASLPFGGYKQSGVGREKGVYGLDEYLQVKAVVTPLSNPAWL